MIKQSIIITAALGVALSAPNAFALTVDTNVSNEQLVETLMGSGITFSNVVVNGAAGSIGTFADGAASVGIDSGVLITTGQASDAIGPNTTTSTGVDNGFGGDADLSSLATGPVSNAASIQFDFTTETGDLFFNYVFASEEYNEWVGSAYNDVFGFFVDGVNIATLPGTDTPVAINNVNNGANSDFYVDNESAALNVQYDGLTTVLTAAITGLSAGIHTIKLVIGDVGDSVWDSGVFLEAGSFNPTNPSAVPELDAKSGASALALLMFAGLLLAGRRRDAHLAL